eukprot:2401673-Prymnesium_polylepis.2
MPHQAQRLSDSRRAHLRLRRPCSPTNAAARFTTSLSCSEFVRPWNVKVPSSWGRKPSTSSPVRMRSAALKR